MVAQDVKGLVVARLPPTFDRRIAQMRRAIRRRIDPFPAGVLVTEPHVGRVAPTGVSEAEPVRPVPPHAHGGDEPQRSCRGKAGFLPQLAGGGILRSFASVDDPAGDGSEPDHHAPGPLQDKDLCITHGIDTGDQTVGCCPVPR
jgi:hypothetical protein